MTLSAVRAALSSLQTCQTDIKEVMDLATEVALDVMDTQGADTSGLDKLQSVVLECANLDREINYYVDVVQQAAQQPPEELVNISQRVQAEFTDRMSVLSDADLHNHPKVLAFTKCIQSPTNPGNSEEEQNIDEDVAVTLTQVNFTCPLTQVDMVNPVKNTKCNHYYDQTAILGLIQARLSQNKRCRCPVVGCGNTNVKESHLIPDKMLQRQIQNKNK